MIIPATTRELWENWYNVSVMWSFLSMQNGMRVLAMFFSCALIFSFGLHTVDTHHAHPGAHTGEQHESSASILYSLGEYAHMGEKKSLFAVASVFLFASLLYSGAWNQLQRMSRLLTVRVRTSVFLRAPLLSWEHILFSQGILNPKLF